jgi:hypothetical protein
MSLAVATHGVPLRLVRLDGRARKGELVLHGGLESGARSESIAGRLNDPGSSFVPLRFGDRVELVNLDHVAFLAYDGEAPEVAERLEVGARRERAELELAVGETLVGELIYTLPPGHARVSDLLNSPGERFVLLVRPSETLFVHRAAILVARTD